MKKTPEGIVKQDIKRGLDSIGAHYYAPVVVGYGKRTVDFPGVCYRGRFIAIEAKREEGGHLTTIQRRYLDSVMKAGGIAIVARNWDEVWVSISHIVNDETLYNDGYNSGLLGMG
jgi:hypothetical protein